MRQALALALLALMSCATTGSWEGPRDGQDIHLSVANHTTQQVTIFDPHNGRRIGICGSLRTCHLTLRHVEAGMTSRGRISVAYREMGWDRRDMHILAEDWARIDWTLDISPHRHLSWLAPTRATEN